MFWGSEKTPPEEIQPPPEEMQPSPESAAKKAKAAKPPKNAPQEVNTPADSRRSSIAPKKPPKNAPQEVNPPPDSRRSSNAARKPPKNAPQEELPESSKKSKEARASKVLPQEAYPPESSRKSKDAGASITKNAFEPQKVSRMNHCGLYKATFYSNIGSFFFGISMGWTGGAERWVMEQSSYDFKPSAAQWDCVCMLLTLGAMAWCLPMGYLLRACGCKRTILMQLLPNTLGWCLTAWAQSISMLYAGRFILGMCGGAHCLAVPIYSAEISPVKKRGAMGVCYYGAYIIGVIYSFALCSVLELRMVNTINLGLLLLGLLQILMPESPVYYVDRGNIPRAESSLRWLRGKDYNMNRELASLMREPSESDHDLQLHPMRGFKYIKVRQSLARMVVLVVLQRLSGGFLFIFYSLELLQCQQQGYELLGTVAAAAFMGFVVAFFLVDRVGRRRLIIYSSAVTFFASIIIGLGLKLYLDNEGDVLPWITLSCMTLFVGAYSVGLGALTLLLSVEMFTPPMRPLGCSITATFNWMAAFLVIFWYSYHKSACQPYFFLVSAIIAVIIMFFTLVYIPETKRLSPKKIQQRIGGIMNRHTTVTFPSASDESDA